ncbi:MAG: PH domain-containing protein [Prolixibacteraceae bacterium]|nr:PH domain-containing protein [Prolixibacteraceae bacterium]
MQISEKFKNNVVLPHQLPPLEEQAFEGLESKYKLLQHFSAAIFLVFILGVFFILTLIVIDHTPKSVLIVVPLLIVLVLTVKTVFVLLGFPKKGYLLRDKDISYRSGLLFYKLTTIPFNRIQHVEVSQSVLEKMVRLSSVKIFTAGGSVSDLSIPGLLPGKAHQIESFLLSKVNLYE